MILPRRCQCWPVLNTCTSTAPLPPLCRMTLAALTTVSFLMGAACSAVAGYTGMWVSVRANVRVAGAARRSAREALVVALRAGSFSGLIVVGLVSAARGRFCGIFLYMGVCL